MSFEKTVADLDDRQPTRMVPGLDRIRAVCELLDHPERAYPSIHITGTNGKTSTAHMTARVLCAHGVATGLYTSPHLSSVTERIALCDAPISKVAFADAYAHLRPFLDQVDRSSDQRVSYFETLTALAYLWFADKPVEAGVFEVGMGGTWDATNLVRGEVAVFCSIDLDHPELGSTIEEVAAEKAGIIKPGSTVVIQETGPAALAVIEGRAAELGSPTLLRGHDYWVEAPLAAVGGQQLTIRTAHGEYGEVFLPLHGPHQAENAAAAAVACEAFLGRRLNAEAVREALAGATVPGRLEVVSRHPLVVLDGAHNVDAARMIAAGLADTFAWRRLHLVIGVLAGKDVDGIADALSSRADVAYACRNASPRSRPAEDVAAACQRAGVPATAHGSVAEALDTAEAAAGEDDLILVSGSLYTVADARPRYVR